MNLYKIYMWNYLHRFLLNTVEISKHVNLALLVFQSSALLFQLKLIFFTTLDAGLGSRSNIKLKVIIALGKILLQSNF
jgi:hypothetical protein